MWNLPACQLGTMAKVSSSSLNILPKRNGVKIQVTATSRRCGGLIGITANLYIGGEMGDAKWMRQGSYKAVSIPAPYGDAQWRLFNVEDDPGEADDLADEMPEMLATLQSAWDIYAEDVGVVPGQ